MTFAYLLDTETTGKVDPEPVEIAWVKLASPLELEPVASFSARYKPSKRIELGALAVHHILDEDVADCPPHFDFVFPTDCEYLIGHNIDYDWKVLAQPPVKRICTLALCRSFYPTLDSHTQSAMMYHLVRDHAQSLLRNAHSAEADVENCLIILRALLTSTLDTCQTWEQLWKVSELARIPQRAPFGKYKDQPIASIPRQYALWAMRQSDFDPYFLQAMKETCL